MMLVFLVLQVVKALTSTPRNANMATTDGAAHLHNQSKDGSKLKDNMEFSLTEDEMKKINYLGKLERRKHRGRSVKDLKVNKFSDQLSLEAQIAMQLAMKDTQAMKKQDGGETDAGVSSPSKSRNGNNHVKFADEQQTPARPDTQCSKHSSFSETFEKRGSVRMSCDLTDDKFDPSSVSKRSLDGMKVENALEIVEIVNHDERHFVDDDVIEQIAQRNSVEKCLVWMEVLGKEGQLPKSAGRAGKSPKIRRKHESSAKT